MSDKSLKYCLIALAFIVVISVITIIKPKEKEPEKLPDIVTKESIEQADDNSSAKVVVSPDGERSLVLE